MSNSTPQVNAQPVQKKHRKQFVEVQDFKLLEQAVANQGESIKALTEAVTKLAEAIASNNHKEEPKKHRMTPREEIAEALESSKMEAFDSRKGERFMKRAGYNAFIDDVVDLSGDKDTAKMGRTEKRYNR